MSKYDVATLLSSGSVGRLKRSTETEPFERDEQAILCEHIRMWIYQKFGDLLENMSELCIKWIVLLEFNEISTFALMPLLIVIKEKIALWAFNWLLVCTN